MRVLILGLIAVLIPSCAGMGAGRPQYEPVEVYQQPAYLRPTLTRRMPQEDVCRSRLYMGLIGQHEGGIAFEAIQGRVRVIKPARTEIDQDDFLQDMRALPPYVEIREYIAGQVLYAPSIRAVSIGDGLGPIEPERLTIELGRDGFVREISCR